MQSVTEYNKIFTCAFEQQIDEVWYIAKNYERYVIPFDIDILLAKKERPEVQFCLGLLYYYGNGDDITPNYSLAFSYFKMSSSKIPSSTYYIAREYFSGNFVKCDYELAFKYFTIAYEANERKSAYFLGLFYKDGIVVKQDYKKAIEYFEDADYEESNYNIGLIHKEEKNYFDAIISFEKAKTAKSYYELGLIYLECLDTPDYIQAIENFKKTNNNHSNIKLGLIYYKGIGVKRNYKVALEYLSKCYSESYFSKDEIVKYIAMSYFYLEHYDMALRYLVEISDDKDICYEIGVCYFHKYKDIQSNIMIEYLKRSTNNEANKFLGCFYFRDETKNNRKSFYHCKKYGPTKDQKVNEILGCHYYSGKVCKRDYKEAYSHFMLALETDTDNNLNKTYGYLGMMYYYGHHVKVNYRTAEYYFNKVCKDYDAFAFACVKNDIALSCSQMFSSKRYIDVEKEH